MYPYVIFDLDGTLLNTLDDLADAGNWVCRRHGWPTHPVETYRMFVGNGIPRLVFRFLPPEARSEETAAAALEEFSARYAAHQQDKTAPYSGVPQLLEQLKKAGVCMAVLSNKADTLAKSVVEHYYPGVFPWVQGALAGVPAKPDPTLLHRVMEQMGADPRRTLFVGDSNVDIRTAKQGGLTSCGVLWGFRSRQELTAEGADVLVEQPAQLAELILNPLEPTEACAWKQSI